jgi:hypothetical protein
MSAIVIATWYEEVSPESAAEGDFESTGNDERTGHYEAHELEDALAEFKHLIEQNNWETSDIRVNEVLYAADPDVDYTNGHEYSDRLVLNIDDPELRKKAQVIIDSWD